MAQYRHKCLLVTVMYMGEVVGPGISYSPNSNREFFFSPNSQPMQVGLGMTFYSQGTSSKQAKWYRTLVYNKVGVCVASICALAQACIVSSPLNG